MTSATDQPAVCHRAGHEHIPAVAVVVYHAQGEPWCLPHAEGFGPQEQPDGAEIVPLGSQRHAELLSAPDTSG